MAAMAGVKATIAGLAVRVPSGAPSVSCAAASSSSSSSSSPSLTSPHCSGCLLGDGLSAKHSIFAASAGARLKRGDMMGHEGAGILHASRKKKFCMSYVAVSAKLGVEENGEKMSRREMTGLVVAAAAALLAVSPAAQAMSVEERYVAETSEVIDKVRYTLGLDKTDPSKVQAVESLKSLSVDWVAKYRREKRVAGKPSFSNMYSVLNAISGHYNNFGPGYPIPMKRRDRILEEVSDAERALSKGR